MRKLISPGQLAFDFTAADARARELEIEKRIAALPRELTRPEPFEGGSIPSKPTPYQDIWFDSRNEAKFALAWDLSLIEWRPDAEKFTDHEGRGYIPDFFLPEFRLWVEAAADTPEARKVKIPRCQHLADTTGMAVLLTRGFPGPYDRLPLLAGGGIYLPHPYSLNTETVTEHFPDLLRLKAMCTPMVLKSFALARKARFEIYGVTWD